ncbi:MAG TPA: DUF2207 domain-containing protein [Burkholderiales bacterium]|nr:DUF2207 domain-containing protein [Burkholderiales bacterium]
MRKLFWLTLLVICLLPLSIFAQDLPEVMPDTAAEELAASAPERILSYHSDIAVYPDASMLVRETIKVRSTGEQIRRGIYRDFPTRYEDKFGNAYRVGFDIQEVLRDGRPDDFHTESLENGVRVYVGNKDVFLDPGEYTYTLAYRTHRQLGFFPDHDELYWNVTGNGWAFAIDRASATVALPPGIGRDDLKLEGYTGYQGSTEKNYSAEVAEDGAAHFTTTHMLGPNQGLTIVVSFPKGIIPEPTRDQKIAWFLADNRPALAAALGLLLVLGYYVVIWTRVGRDPDPGAIMPLYEPPQNLSPAAMRHLVRMGFDDKTFAAAVLNMAVKKYLTIREEGSDYTLERATAQAGLTADEKAAASRLLDSRKSIELKTTNHATIRSAIDGLKESLKNSQETVYFLTNKRYLIPGLVLSALTLLAQVVAAQGVERKALAGFMTIWLTGWSFGVFFLLMTVFRAWKAVMFGGVVNRALSVVGALFITAFAVPFVGGEGFGIYMYSQATSPVSVAVLLTIVAVNVLFHYLLKAPTSAGRMLLDKVEGFKMFLTAVDSDRLRRFEGPARTPELFEKYLPYALALDCEQQWADQFTEVLAKAAEAGQTSSYSPSWYRGSNWNAFNPGGFASSFGSSFSSAVSSSSTAPGSSSGSSGGGSSGGGGGGGGGGGW